MFEAIGAANEYCFKEMNFHSIEANTDPENEGSGGCWKNTVLCRKLTSVKISFSKERF